MKQYLLSLSLFLTVFIAAAQNFEGKIIYQNSFKSKIPAMTDAQFNEAMGNKQEYFIKDNNYKSVSNGSLLQWQLYSPLENKLYSKMANSEVAYWADGSLNADKILTVELNKSVTEVLGYSCDEVVLTCQSGVQKYYFNSKLAVDPQKFVNHKYGNWYEYISKAKALPLKIMVDNAQFTLESTATEVQPTKLNYAIFKLPADLKTEKSPY